MIGAIQGPQQLPGLIPLPKNGPEGEPYKNNPVKRGKTILLVDDICTQGNSFEAGRAFVERAGAKAICLSWLKTINTDYNAIAGNLPIANPYAPFVTNGKVPVYSHWYHTPIVDPSAATDLAEVYRNYFGWNWPSGN